MELVLPASPTTDNWHNPRAFRSRKTRGRVYAPSRLHEDALILMTLDEEVETIETATAKWDLRKPLGTWASQYQVTTVDGSVRLLDVILNATLDHPVGRGVCELIAEAARDEGIDWHPIYEDDLRVEPRNTNLRNVYGARATVIPPGDRIRLLQMMEDVQDATLVDVAKLASSQVDGVSVLMALVFEGLATFDINGSMVPETAMRRTPLSYAGVRDAT